MKYRCGIPPFFLFLTVFYLAAFPIKLAAEDTVHVVEKGETVYSISRSYHISQEELMRYNNVGDASKLRIGMRLKIPRSISFTEYSVAKNDTLYSIARKNGVSLAELRDANNFKPDHILKAGELIRIPLTGSNAVSTTTSGVAARTNAPPAISAEVRPVSSKGVDSSLRWPVSPRESAYMTGKLYGVVLTGERSEPVKSLTQGTVVSAGPYRGFGRVAIIQTAGGYLYVYGGCENLLVKEGDKVGPGTELGKLGLDAVSEKPQLFFLVYRNNAPIDPAKAPRA
jgi:murein DD-endopeptidase MepM/ murein hydrolase activator NlpD